MFDIFEATPNHIQQINDLPSVYVAYSTYNIPSGLHINGYVKLIERKRETALAKLIPHAYWCPLVDGIADAVARIKCYGTYVEQGASPLPYEPTPEETANNERESAKRAAYHAQYIIDNPPQPKPKRHIFPVRESFTYNK